MEDYVKLSKGSYRAVIYNQYVVYIEDIDGIWLARIIRKEGFKTLKFISGKTFKDCRHMVDEYLLDKYLEGYNK